MTYASPELPPSWLMVEMLTIGQLTSVYRNLRRRADRTTIARSVGLTAPVQHSFSDEPARHGHPRRLGERRVLESTDFLNDPVEQFAALLHQPWSVAHVSRAGFALRQCSGS